MFALPKGLQMIYFYYGENIQERDAAVSKLLQEFRAVNGDMAIDSIDAETAELADVIDAVTTVPFLAPKRLVVLRYMSTNKELAASIDVIIDRVADSTDMLIIEARLDARGVYMKTLKKRATTVHHFESVEGNLLQSWLLQDAKAVGVKISPAVAQELIDRVGHNQLLLHNELQKLSLMSPTITSELVRSATHYLPASSVFAMLDAALQGNVARASTLYEEQRIQGVEPQSILGMIAWQLHITAIVVASKGKTAEEIAKTAKLNPFVVRKNMALTKKMSKQTITHMLDAAIAADIRIKTGKSKPDPEIHLLLMNLAQTMQA